MTELPQKATGTAAIVRAFNQLRQCVLERTILRDENWHADYQTNGFRLIPRFGRSKTSQGTKQFVLKYVRNDYLLCLPYSSPASAEDIVSGFVAEDSSSLIKIAKPHELRNYDFDGLTVDGWSYDTVDTSPGFLAIRRHATRVTDSKKEIQQVVPHYMYNWLIYADQPEGGTNAYDGADNLIAWSDTNRAGRIFCKTNVRIDADGSF
jgi:hypothetical protein